MYPTIAWILRLHCCFWFLIFAESRVPQEEVNALQQIAKTMGATYLSFNADLCKVEDVGVTVKPLWSEKIVECDNEDHIKKIVLKGLNLPGVLPPELVKLPDIQQVDFAYNYLSGGIPVEWATTQLTNISVTVNRLSGEIPKQLGNISSLLYLNLEANQFSGRVPSELGKLVNLQSLILSSNQLVGKVPTSFSELVNLTDFRISDNNFSGQIPDFIQNWKQLTKLEMHSTGLEGPIPSNISLLNKLTDLRISDIGGPAQAFPSLSDTMGMHNLILRSCSLSGELPVYIWAMKDLQTLDVSFNKLVGEIPNNISARSMLKFVFLTGNLLSGDIPDSILKNGINIDLSYNNFTWQGPDQHACRQNMNLYVNLYKSSAAVSPLMRILPCTKDFTCRRYGCSLHVNSGGNDFTVKESDGEVDYAGDASVDGGSARYFHSSTNYWGLSSTGDFMDDNNDQNARFIESIPSKSLSELYNNARMSPLSLTYFRYCLRNGSYNVSLHFAEISFTNDSTYTSLGRRVFDIYIQEKLVWKDFNIVNEAGGVQTPVVRHFNTIVTDNFLEIRFYWAGKGTIRIPSRGHYGPLISAISLKTTFGSCSEEDKKSVTVYVIVGVVATCIFLLVMSTLWWKGYLQCKKKHRKDLDGMELQTISFTLKQIKAATNNFDASNKIGEGGFGAVYKGRLSDGTLVAVKQLSHKSRQGNREFLNEIAMISCLQHPNLVKLHGCCIEGTELLLVYEYLENNNLARALFNSEKSQLILDWPTRFKICVGIAKGLAFLHEESSLKIVHRDIKATNVLLDRDLNPKISDFGLARLTEDDNTHISTRVAGTIGYMAPEYALWGYLTYKADVYSFGIVLLEIVSGKNNYNYVPSNNFICLLDWACHLLQNGKLEELIDDKLGSQFNKAEAERIIKVALLCTSATPSLRPVMSEAVGMLEGKRDAPVDIPEASMYTDDLRFKALKDFQQERQHQSASSNQAQFSSIQTAHQKMASLCASRAAIFNSKKLLTISPNQLCLRSTSFFYCSESLNTHDRIPTGNNLKPQEKLEDLICRMMSTRAWTTRLQNSIRNIVPSFDHELVYNVLHGAKNSEHALQFFRWVERSGLFRHDRETHFKIIQILGRAGKLNHARCILLDMPNKGVDWDEDLWVLMIDSYGKAGIVQESVKLFQKMEELGVERTVKSYNALFNVITRRGRYMMAKRYFNKMVSQGIEPTGHTYNLLIWGFFLSSKVDTAVRFFEDMKSKGIMPDVVTYNTMINGYNRVKKIEEAEKYFVEMKARNIEPNVISYTTLIKGYTSVGRIDDALRLFEEMKSFGIKPNAITYSTLLPGLCDAQKMSEAGMILKEMEEKYIAPKDNSIFIRLISGQCEAGDLDAAADVLKTMIRLSVPTEAGHYGVLIENFCKAGIYDRAVKFLDKLIEKEIVLRPQSSLSMEPSAYNPIIDYLCNNGQTGKAETLFRQLMKTGVQDPVAFNNLVCGHAREGVPDKAFELLKIMGRRKVLSDGIAYKSLVESYLKKGEPADAKTALDNMLEHGHDPEPLLYRSVMESLMEDGRVQTASRVMKIMLEKGVKEYMDLISTILEALLMRGHVEEALGRIELLLNNSLSPDLDGLLSVLCEKGKTTAALKLLDFVLERNCNIDFSSYDKVLDSLVAAGKTLNAYSILCKMMETGGVKDYKSCEELIKSLNDEGNTKQADILRRMILGKEITLDSKKGKRKTAIAT